MTSRLRVSYERSEVLDLFLALHRELAGRFSWEISFLPRPVTADVALLRDGVRKWRGAGLDGLPAWLAADAPGELLDGEADPAIREGTKDVVTALEAAGTDIRAALGTLEELRIEAVRTLEAGLCLDQIEPRLRAALGVGAADFSLPLHCVPLAPLPAAGFLADGTRLAAAYVDCRRYTGAMLVESVLTLVSWALLHDETGTDSLSAQLAARLPGTGPYHRRLRAVLIKVLVEMTAGALVRGTEPAHRPGVDVLGTAWRFPRLFGAASRHWAPYLSGLTDRAEALDALAADLSACSPRWYIDCVDAASLAADFYLLEWLAAAGDAECARDFARWVPQLARDLAGQIDLVIGSELGHFERARDSALPGPLAAFLRQVTAGDSQAAWPRVRSQIGPAAALRLAAEAFGGPGSEFGGAAWAPIAAMLRRYVCDDLPHRVFIDQCFTMQHNNGCVFDKCFDVTDVAAVLDAQAAGDLVTLARHASDRVRDAWRRHQSSRQASFDATWLGLPADQPAEPAQPTEHTAPAQHTEPAQHTAPAQHTEPEHTAPAEHTEPAQHTEPAEHTERARRADPGWLELAISAAPPGGLGCGSSADPSAFAADRPGDADQPVQPRRSAYRRPRPTGIDGYDHVRATLHTDSGSVLLVLWPGLAPGTVDNFIKLACGKRPWIDPDSRITRTAPFYDGTSFYRRVPGYLIQGGDRTGTGAAGPGYRIPDEIPPDLAFDRPFVIAMANTGRDSAGSQFFVTLAPARHLDGQYAQFGEVADEPSRDVVVAISLAPEPVTLRTVTIVASAARGRRASGRDQE